MKSTTTNSRRDFLKMSAITGGGLVLGFNWFSAEASAPVVFSSIVAGDINFNSYLSIASNGAITIMSPNPELGQNIITSFPMVVAEELEADWKMVKVLQANLDNKFDRQLTGGSGAVPHSWKLLRNAGADYPKNIQIYKLREIKTYNTFLEIQIEELKNEIKKLKNVAK